MISIPSRYQKAEYEDVPEKIRETFRKMVKKDGRGLFIHGEVGVGKTHISIALKKKWDSVYPTRPAHFWTTPELLQDIRDDFDRDNYDKRRNVAKLIESQAPVFLDDLGSEQPTGWVLEQLYLLINGRYLEEKPLVITSNLSVEQIGQTLGDRIASRIVEMCEVVELSGKDRRMTP